MVETAEPSRRDLYLVRLYYFVTIGSTGFLFPFISLFFHRQGLSGTEIGLLGTVQASAALVAALLAGNLSDRWQRPIALIQIMLLGAGLTGLLLGRQDRFLPIALLVGLNALFGAGISPISDNLASIIAARYDDVGFGSIRLWGSLGWSLVTSIAGWLIEVFSLYFAFVANAVGLGVAALVVNFLPHRTQEPGEKSGKAGQTLNFRQGINAIRQNKRLTILTLGLGISWLFGAGLYQFEAIYLDDLGASETVIGLANAITALVEIPSMLWADRMMKRNSPGWLLRSSLLLLAGRMICVLAFPNISMIMAMRLFLGVQYAFYAVGVVGYVNAYAAKAYRVTALALIAITLQNLMTMIGSPVSGVIYDLAGAYWVYALTLAGALGGWLVLWKNKYEQG